jgi:hypothetical protein
MTAIQIFTIALAISTSFLAVFLGVFLNNNRLNDVKELLGAKIEASRAGASTEVAGLRVLIEKNHSEMMVRPADIEGRLTRIENERRILQ